MKPDTEAFERAKKKIMESVRPKLGIGTLSEKSVHAILKNYYEPDESRQEVPVDNFVADICSDGKIIEIQTRQMEKLREKLGVFLPRHEVTVVHPITADKTLVLLDGETGRFVKMRKSPKKGNKYLVFPELYKIKMYLKDPNFRLRILLLAVQEYRLVNYGPWDKTLQSETYDRVPSAIVEEIAVDSLKDYRQFIPEGLDTPFTSKQFAKAARIPTDIAQSVLNILYFTGTLTRVGKEVNQYLYEILNI